MDPEFVTPIVSILCYVGSEAAFERIKEGFQELRNGMMLTLMTILTLMILCYIYNVSNFGKLPELYCKKNSQLHYFIKENVATLHRPYKPPVWCGESRLQTIVRYFTPCRSDITWERETVRDKDGGVFYIDWCQNNANPRFPASSDRPTVLIVPGLTSTSSSSYILSIADCLASQGYRIMVLIYRGLDGNELKTPLSFCATYTEDLEHVVNVHHRRYPKSDLYAIGASLGSTILGRYLCQEKDKSKMKAGVLFCCSFDPEKCIKEMEKTSNLLLMNYQVTQNIKKYYRRNKEVFKGVVDDKLVEKACFLREFDNHFTAPVFGFANSDEYYKEASLVNRLNEIEVPVLCVGATDDPFSPEWALPKKEICESDNVAMVMTYGGGHVSHIEEQFPFSKSYFELVMLEYFGGFLRE